MATIHKQPILGSRVELDIGSPRFSVRRRGKGNIQIIDRQERRPLSREARARLLAKKMEMDAKNAYLAHALELYKRAEFIWSESGLGSADLTGRPENKVSAKMPEGIIHKGKKGFIKLIAFPFKALGYIPIIGYLPGKLAHWLAGDIAPEYLVSPKGKPIAQLIKEMPPGAFEARKDFYEFTRTHNINPDELDKYSQLVDRLRRPQIKEYYPSGKDAADAKKVYDGTREVAAHGAHH